MAAITICSDFRAPQNKVTTVSPSISHEVMGPDVKQINIRVHVHVCVQSLSFGQHFVAPWTVAPPGSSAHAISQARILEWVAIFFSRGSSLPCSLHIPACMPSCFSHVWFFVTKWTVAHQAPLSMEFSRQEWVAMLSSGDLLNPEIEPASPRDQTCVSCVSCIGRWVLHHLCHLGSPCVYIQRPYLAQPSHPGLNGLVSWERQIGNYWKAKTCNWGFTG